MLIRARYLGDSRAYFLLPRAADLHHHENALEAWVLKGRSTAPWTRPATRGLHSGHTELAVQAEDDASGAHPDSPPSAAETRVSFWGSIRSPDLESALAPAYVSAAPFLLEGAAAGIERRHALAGRARWAVPGLIDSKRATGKFLSVQSLYSLGRILLGLVLYKGESPWPSGDPVEGHDDVGDGAHAAEPVLEIVAGYVEAQVPDKDFS